jgi:hypothetical protein
VLLVPSLLFQLHDALKDEVGRVSGLVYDLDFSMRQAQTNLEAVRADVSGKI